MVVAALTWRIWQTQSASVYAIHKSPDEKYMIRVMQYPQIFGHMPGEAGGGSGYVELIDVQTSRVMQRKDVNMVMTIDVVEWEPKEVYIKLFTTWPLGIQSEQAASLNR